MDVEGAEQTTDDGFNGKDSHIQSSAPKNDEQWLLGIFIRTYDIGWKLSESDFLENNSQFFELMITEAPDALSRSFLACDKRQNRNVVEIDHEDVIQFPGFAKRVLKSDGCVLLVTKIDMFQEWFNSFLSSGFRCME